MKRLLSLVCLIVLIAAGCTTAATPTEAPAPVATEVPAEVPATEVPPVPQELILATTTSTQDSGLLDYLLPMFTEETGVTFKVIAVGSGQAIQLGKDGNADVLLVHSPAAEKDFMATGDGVRREDVMYNDFVILGPAGDPAGIKGLTSAVDAFKKLAETGSTFISRGDDSGTHSKEKSVWTKAEITPEGKWYVSAGQGMGEVLTMADEQQAYTLSDRATYLTRKQAGLNLDVLVEGDKALFNPYGVIAVNPAKNPAIKADLANQFIDWIISVPTQETISKFGFDTFGQSLFTPSSALWVAAHTEPAALTVKGKVETETVLTLDQLKALNPVTVTVAHPKKGDIEVTGVYLADVLALAKVKSDAAKVVFTASDGFTSEIDWPTLQACTGCMVSIGDDGVLGTAMPDMTGSMWVKDLVSVEIQ